MEKNFKNYPIKKNTEIFYYHVNKSIEVGQASICSHVAVRENSIRIFLLPFPKIGMMPTSNPSGAQTHLPN